MKIIETENGKKNGDLCDVIGGFENGRAKNSEGVRRLMGTQIDNS
jgi:hypothetical protein